MKNLLNTYISGVLADSALPPKYVSVLETVLINYYNEHILDDVGDDYPKLVKTLYGFRDDVEYTIVAVSNIKPSYALFIIRKDKIFPRAVTSAMISLFKQNNHTNHEFGALIENLNKDIWVLKDILISNTRSSRVSTVVQEDKFFIVPPTDELQFFYECGRKTKYISEEEAISKCEGNNNVYQCAHCKNYHQGTPPTGVVIPAEIMYNRWITAWRRKKQL